MSVANSHAPETIGNYVIENALAHGSMGTVYVARHSLTYARVALKVIRSEANADKQAEERFLREVRAAAQIGHEGIVKVQDAGKTPEGHLYLAMELLTGETLEERFANGTGERLTGMEWLAAMLDPLMAAHTHSIVHRDLKPANVFIARSSDGTEHIKLLDFGLARDTREKSGTQT
ncbi:MAG TPA: serine/threonine-protein kinase, partial [Polyangiales bacterium]|nr:serine/threonine-protein kinase [Polyangiales bacterium]